jgi:hypothetical protein
MSLDLLGVALLRLQAEALRWIYAACDWHVLRPLVLGTGVVLLAVVSRLVVTRGVSPRSRSLDVVHPR